MKSFYILMFLSVSTILATDSTYAQQSNSKTSQNGTGKIVITNCITNNDGKGANIELFMIDRPNEERVTQIRSSLDGLIKSRTVFIAMKESVRLSGDEFVAKLTYKTIYDDGTQDNESSVENALCYKGKVTEDQASTLQTANFDF
jgi:hypothetical protein